MFSLASKVCPPTIEMKAVGVHIAERGLADAFKSLNTPPSLIRRALVDVCGQRMRLLAAPTAC